jgi:hypothetical protein
MMGQYGPKHVEVGVFKYYCEIKKIALLLCWLYLNVYSVTKQSLKATKKTAFKGKGHPRTGHEGPEGEQMSSSTLP